MAKEKPPDKVEKALQALVKFGLGEQEFSRLVTRIQQEVLEPESGDFSPKDRVSWFTYGSSGPERTGTVLQVEHNACLVEADPLKAKDKPIKWRVLFHHLRKLKKTRKT